MEHNRSLTRVSFSWARAPCSPGSLSTNQPNCMYLLPCSAATRRRGGSIFGLRSPTLAFFLVHVVQVIRAGWNNFRAMIIGYEISPDKMARREEVPDEQSISPS